MGAEFGYLLISKWAIATQGKIAQEEVTLTHPNQAAYLITKSSGSLTDLAFTPLTEHHGIPDPHIRRFDEYHPRRCSQFTIQR